MFTVFIAFILILFAILFIYIGSQLVFKLGLENRMREPAKSARESKAGAPKTCPVCAIKLLKGEQVSSSVFPTMDGKERIMHIKGCPYCLKNEMPRKRVCPVCLKTLSAKSYLVAKLYTRPGRDHVHVLGCVYCRKA